MNYTEKIRKNYSKKIITTNNDLKSQLDVYLQRLDSTISELTDETSTDYLNRQNLLDAIHGYLDVYNEIRYLGHYKLANNKATDFISTKTIKLSDYIRGFLDQRSEVAFEDCKKCWDPFLKYSPSRPTTSVNPTDLWDSNSITVENNQKANPNSPSKSDFQNIVQAISDKPYPVAMDVIDDLYIIKRNFLTETDVAEKDYSSLLNDFTITPDNSKVSYTKDFSSFGYKTFTISESNDTKDFSYATKIKNLFAENTYHLFYNSTDNSSFGLGKVIKSEIRVIRKTLKPEFLRLTSGNTAFDTLVFDSSDVYWNCEYYVDITFEFNILSGKSVTLVRELTQEIATGIISNYSVLLKSILQNAKNNFEHTTEIIKLNDNGKYENLMSYLPTKISNFSTSLSILNTIVSDVSSWVKQREKSLKEIIKDEILSETCSSMLKERLNKTNGSLFGWYTQNCLPLSDDYERYLNKIENNIAIFKTMLVAPIVSLDYTEEKNGGKEIIEKDFVDIEGNNFIYYSRTNLKNFQVGDTVYLLDDNNPEISAKIKKIEKWTGTKNGEDISLRRIFLNIIVPNIYSDISLRIIRN